MDNDTKTQIAKAIVDGIEWDVNDRRGMHMSDFDDEVQEEIRGTWQKIIMKALGD